MRAETDGTTAAPSERRVSRTGRSIAWLPPIAFLVTALAVTWPWLRDPDAILIAPIGGDVSTSVAKFDAIVRSDVIPFVADRITSVGFPEGVETTPGLDGVSAFSATFLWLGSAAIGPVATHGLLAVLGFFLTATVTYLFVRRVTGSTGAGLVAGTAYGFSPHLALITYAATTYSHMWLFVLPMWAFWNLTQDPTRRAALLAGLSLVPAMFWTPYFTLHAFAISMSCLVVVALLAPRVGLRRRTLGLVLVPWIMGFAAYAAIGVASSFSDVPDRPLQDFYDQAAHPLMFVWPGAYSIYGDGVAEALVDVVPRAASANLYVGLSVLILAAIGAFTALRPWVTARLRGAPSPEGMAALLGLAVVVTCFVCSLPPRVAGGSVPTPASVIFELAPGLRAGQRFVMPLMAGTALLAGLGAAHLLRHVRPRAVAPVAVALALVIGVDLYARPPQRTEEVPARTPALAALERAPDAPAIHIGPHGWLGGTPQRPCFFQQIHRKTLVNVCHIAAPSDRMWQLGNRPICETIGILRRSGLRYVLTEPVPPPRNVVACFRQDSVVGPWRVLGKDSQLWIYELVPGKA